mmetsp:Transcript_24616/g.24211  ORF Transcript_24616/g.24211 Transcript_24616/m.24211 type:complete len:118 (-) Transcript_24616:39-392(-)
MMKMKLKGVEMRGMNYSEAVKQGYLREGPPPTPEEIAEIEKNLIEPKLNMYGLRFPEKDAKTEADYMRVSFKEEDQKYLEEQGRLTLTEKEYKRLGVEVMDDNWDEDMSMYSHKRRP